MHIVNFTKSAVEELRGLQQQYQRQVASKIKSLAENPFPPGVKKLGGGGGYRIRSGDFRILYTVESNTVTVYAIGDRKDVYK